MIANKQLFYRLYEEGRIGNRVRQWNSLNELNQSDYFGEVSVRCHIPNSKLGAFHVCPKELPKVLDELIQVNKLCEADFLFCESPPDERLIFQGEVYRSHRGLEMLYSFAKMAMRPALAQFGRRDHGLVPFLLITQHMDASSQENLWRLMEKYPTDIIEFSVYEMPVGIEEKNTLFWEVRGY